MSSKITDVVPSLILAMRVSFSKNLTRPRGSLTSRRHPVKKIIETQKVQTAQKLSWEMHTNTSILTKRSVNSPSVGKLKANLIKSNLLWFIKQDNSYFSWECFMEKLQVWILSLIFEIISIIISFLNYKTKKYHW